MLTILIDLPDFNSLTLPCTNFDTFVLLFPSTVNKEINKPVYSERLVTQPLVYKQTNY